ncbi:hypothetical protein MNBD_PLANCTO03-279 [hydrothermal vent metagenome]|uniref:Pyrrolo-quinoline quinone repeat domain-containing protein n=1 Tax=hydrothermal vent metagenome TaxID=652676 RepID=A0A3B1DJJ8_9ZZZZ
MTPTTPTTRQTIRRSLPRLAAGLTLAALLALPAGCGLGAIWTSDSAPSAGASTGNSGPGSLIDQRREAFKIDHDAYASLGYRLDWRGFPVVAAGEHIQFLDLYDDIVVAHESAATVSILEASNGELRNSSQIASPLTRFVGNFRTDNLIVVSSDTDAAIIDIQTGEIIQRDHLDRVISTAPVYFANHKIYGTSIGHVYAHYMTPPVNAWAYDLGSPIDADLVLVGPTVVAVSRRGDIAMLDAASGTLLARAKIFGGCEADPVAGTGMVFFASLDQSIYAFDLNGKQQWRIRTEQPLRLTPTYHDGVLYVPSNDKGLRAINANTGTQLWNQPKIAGRVVAMRSGKLITWDGTTASTLDPTTGDVIFSTELTEVEILKPDHFVDGNLYAVSTGGIIAKFQPRD